jgi:hypothetical protein
LCKRNGLRILAFRIDPNLTDDTIERSLNTDELHADHHQ